MFWPDPTHQPTQPPTHPPNYMPTHGWGSLHRFQIFKQNWNISISSSAIEFWLIPGVPLLGGGGGWMWVGEGERVPPTYVHMHAHACACAYDIIGNSQGITQWGSHLHEIIMFTMHACMCVHVCAYACVWEATPTTPHPHPPTPYHPEPQGAKNNNSWTNRDNSILYEDSLPLNIPELI